MRECQEHVTSNEFTQWQAYVERSPLLPERLDWLAAHIVMHVRAVMSMKRGTIELTDCLPYWHSLKPSAHDSEESREEAEFARFKYLADVHNQKLRERESDGGTE